MLEFRKYPRGLLEFRGQSRPSVVKGPFGVPWSNSGALLNLLIECALKQTPRSKRELCLIKLFFIIYRFTESGLGRRNASTVVVKNSFL